MQHHPLFLYVLTSLRNRRETVPDGQFRWGAVLLKSNGGAYYGRLVANGNRDDSVMAKGGLTARRTCQAGAKAEHSEPTVRIRCGGRLSDKSYPGDNRLVLPKSPNRRQCSAPRCRLILTWGWRSSQGYGCSPFKKVRELGSNRRETGWS